MSYLLNDLEKFAAPMFGKNRYIPRGEKERWARIRDMDGINTYYDYEEPNAERISYTGGKEHEDYFALSDSRDRIDRKVGAIQAATAVAGPLLGMGYLARKEGKERLSSKNHPAKIPAKALIGAGAAIAGTKGAGFLAKRYKYSKPKGQEEDKKERHTDALIRARAEKLDGILNEKWGSQAHQGLNKTAAANKREAKMNYLLDDLMSYEMRKEASLLNPYEGDENISKARRAYREARRLARKTSLAKDKEQEDQLHTSLRDLKATADMTRRKKPASAKESILAQEYEQQGLTGEEAKLKAFRRHRLKKRLSLGAATAGAVGAGIGAYKYRDYVTDKTIKAGTSMQHIRAGEDTHFDKGPFFTSHRPSDNEAYRGMYSKEIRERAPAARIGKSELEATQDIKIPSRKKTKAEFQALLRENPDSLKTLRRGIDDTALAFRWVDPNPWSKRNRMLAKAKKRVAKGVVDGTVYDAANIQSTKSFRDFNPEFAEQIEQGLYNRLKSKGYHGVADRNDQKYSPYKTKSSNILFDAKDKYKVKSDELLPDKKISEDFSKFIARRATRGAIKGGSIIAAARAGLGLSEDSAKEKDQDRKVKAYRQTHPESKLSYHEIIAL